ncbi:MAG: hypothetical protein L6R37_005021 [Teloschistes peruensis]|nr:MAG: hypothetical protein L6R37_005021 [Teloschistes peruensis]
MSDSEDDLSKGLDHQEPTRSHPAPPPAALQPNGRHSSEPPETQTKTQTGYQHSNNMASPQADGTQANGTQPQNQIRTQPDSISQQLPPSRQKSPVEEAPIDPKQPLEAFGWDDLEERFLRKMEECQKGEEELEKEFRGWCEVFQAWATTTREHEEERLHKRLKTRMAWVQNSEQKFEEKRQHYIKVVQAFESALALLGGS